MQTTTEKIKCNPQEIYRQLGRVVVETDESFISLQKMAKEKLISFDSQKLTFTYFLKFPIDQEDGTQIDSLIVRQARGGEIIKIPDFTQHIKVSLDMVAIQNGFSSAIAERLFLQDIVNLTALIGLFT